jgi:hypothetical protein
MSGWRVPGGRDPVGRAGRPVEGTEPGVECRAEVAA